MKVLAFKLVATAAVAVALAWPLVRSDEGGVLAEVQRLGAGRVLALVAAFLFAVWLYARSLVRALELVPAPLRAASPRSVWWMFALPYNFVEDFFIVHHVERSLRAALPGTRGLSLGAAAGYGWCAAQIASLVPHRLAAIPSALALVLWVVHWAHIGRANALLLRQRQLGAARRPAAGA